MVTTPFQVFLPLILGVYALVVWLGAFYLLYKAARVPRAVVETPEGPATATLTPRHAQTRRRVLLVTGFALILCLLLGSSIIPLIRPSGKEHASLEFGPVTRHLRGPGGATLAVEEAGPAGAPRIIFTHGWGADRREWQWAQKSLSSRFRVITWDLPGLGQSEPYPNADYDLNHMAADLRTVIESTGPGPVILVGHSIGGMINLTLCKQRQGSPGQGIAGIVQLNTTYTNPVKTVKGHDLQLKLQKPLFEPLLQIVTAASPVVRALNLLGYQSGVVHLYTAFSSFAGMETREQLDFVARYYYRSSPAVVARGTLAMLAWDAEDVLPTITVPMLIVSGDQDSTTLPSASDYMASKIPRSLRYSVSPAAHLGPVEQHARYNRVIETFALSRLEGEREASRSQEGR